MSPETIIDPEVNIHVKKIIYALILRKLLEEKEKLMLDVVRYRAYDFSLELFNNALRQVKTEIFNLAEK